MAPAQSRAQDADFAAFDHPGKIKRRVKKNTLADAGSSFGGGTASPPERRASAHEYAPGKSELAREQALKRTQAGGESASDDHLEC